MTFFQKFKVSGHSMMPTLKPGQEILISSLPFLFSKPKVGQIIAFKDQRLFIIKRIKAIKEGRYLVEGDNKKDSKKFGWVKKEEIIGKVIYIISS